MAADYLQQHRCRGKNGVRVMEQWLEGALEQRRPAQSGLEQLLIDCLLTVGLPEPERQYPLVLATGEVIHLDIAWPSRLLAVEPGAARWHGGALEQRRDHARDRGVQRAGLARDPVRRVVSGRSDGGRAPGPTNLRNPALPKFGAIVALTATLTPKFRIGE